MADARWQVHKFGGSSLADADCFRRVANIILAEDVPRQAVVVSAMRGMTDELLALVETAESGRDGYARSLAGISARYCDTLEQLIQSKGSRTALKTALDTDLADIKDLLDAIGLVGAAEERSRNIVSGYGEIWSARLLAALIDSELESTSRNRDVEWVDARQLIVVDQGEMGPSVDWEASALRLPAVIGADAGGIRVMTGYIAADSSGRQTVLGRNGSDFSASILAALLKATKISIWTDVDGVMSADPARVPEAAIIHELSYNEAMELAYFGAKVLHPQTMAPAVDHDIPIYIRNTFNQAAPGSRIDGEALSGPKIKGITSVENIALINLEGAGMIGVPGTANRLFGELREAGLSVILISQASSEHSICFAVPQAHAEDAEVVVRRAFSAELESGQVQHVGLQKDCSIVAVVGDGMAGLPGVSGRFFGALGNAGINVRAIAQGSSERNISAVVAQEEATRALRAVHAGFYLSANTLSVGLVGPGNVGAVLIDQMSAQLEHLRSQFNLDVRVRAIATSTRMLMAERSIDLSDWSDEMARNGQPIDWKRFEQHVNAEHLPHAVIIDCSASDEVASRYPGWLTGDIHVVTPNKRAFSGSMENYDAVRDASRLHNMHLLYETTVGAALPVIETLKDLCRTGDEIRNVEGIFSGTLAYLFNVFDGSVAFSDIVRSALEQGYTEPDPRDDLTGMDVARKLIILGRELGLRLELDDLEVESLAPAELMEHDVDGFLDGLRDHDVVMADRLNRARERNEVLRYVGRLDAHGQATVKLESLPTDHPFARLNLTDNIVRFESSRYSANPLVVQGPGAGPEVTAGGVFADLLRLASYLGAGR